MIMRQGRERWWSLGSCQELTISEVVFYMGGGGGGGGGGGDDGEKQKAPILALKFERKLN